MSMEFLEEFHLFPFINFIITFEGKKKKKKKERKRGKF